MALIRGCERCLKPCYVEFRGEWAHPCCVLNAVPVGGKCPACSSSTALARQHEDRKASRRPEPTVDSTAPADG